MSVVAETVLTYLPPKRKTTPSGWTSFNAPCCHHNGHTADKRNRGGLISNPDGGVSYHCFNCGFKASWQPGRNFSHKLRKLLQWLGAPDDIINKVAFDVMRENEGVDVQEHVAKLPTFNTVPLPDDATKVADIKNFDKYSLAILEYMSSRNLNLDDTDYYWSPSLGYRDRLIVPFYYEKRIVGWTGRSIVADKKPKYLTEVQPGFVYGLDEQGPNKIFCIVVEGQLDAIHIDGCALGGSEIADQQAMLLNRLQKQIIVVPDRDKAGSKLVEESIEKGWCVSMPEWSQDICDVGDAVSKYGRLYTLYSIVNAANESPLKIRLRAKKWFT
jgi:hypothetical protein|tara:strand:+ start:4448 stop:5431 length:984 start_codon:yes stop_codon:yes gene_type:complete